MKTVTVTDARQRFGALLDAAQRAPVLIRRQNRDAAVIMSAQEYERIQGVNNAELERTMDRIGAEAATARSEIPSGLVQPAGRTGLAGRFVRFRADQSGKRRRRSTHAGTHQTVTKTGRR